MRNKIEFKRPGKAANKDNWNKFLMAIKVREGVFEAKEIVGGWGGTANGILKNLLRMTTRS